MGYMPPQNNIMQVPPTPDEFKSAAGMHSFTVVYFNRSHTVAMTEIGMYCGGLCGNWVVLARTNGQWQIFAVGKGVDDVLNLRWLLGVRFALKRSTITTR